MKNDSEFTSFISSTPLALISTLKVTIIPPRETTDDFSFFAYIALSCNDFLSKPPASDLIDLTNYRYTVPGARRPSQQPCRRRLHAAATARYIGVQTIVLHFSSHPAICNLGNFLNELKHQCSAAPAIYYYIHGDKMYELNFINLSLFLMLCEPAASILLITF